MCTRIIYIVLLTSLSGCVIPVSSSCIDSQKYEHPDANHPPKNSKCDAFDAAVYVMAATAKTLEDEGKESKTEVKQIKCSDMIGRAQKECSRKERELYDPLDEL